MAPVITSGLQAALSSALGAQRWSACPLEVVPGSLYELLLAPFHNLFRVRLQLARPLRFRLVITQRHKRYLGLELRCEPPARSGCYLRGHLR